MATSGDPEYETLIEGLLQRCLVVPPGRREDELDRACAEHAEHAAELRARMRLLRRSGLLTSGSAGTGAPAPEPDGRAGEVFGEFRLLRELGRGGMGVVHLAEQPALHRRVALKLIRGDIVGLARARARFRREIEAVSALDHPGICTVYGAGEVDGTPYIAMRYVEGEPLNRRLADARARGDTTTGAREVDAAVELIERVARALHHAHERGLIHRDVKPGNIMVTPDGRPVLLDFGLARAEEGSGDSMTLSGDTIGTPAYMSPEQISPAGRRADRRADVYSLGVTLYECLTLHNPFAAPTREELYRKILITGKVDATRYTRAVPRDLHLVLATAVERDRDRRYQTALDFAEDLRRVRELQPIAARRPPAWERTWRWVRREPLRAAVIALLLVGLPAVGGLAGYLLAVDDEIRAGERALAAAEIDRQLALAFRMLAERPGAAVLEFERALALDASSLEALGGQVLALARAGQADRARALLESRAGARLTALRSFLSPDAGAHGLGMSAPDLPDDAHAVEHLFAGMVEIVRGDAGVAGAYERAYDHCLTAVLRSPTPRLPFLQELTRAAGEAGNARQIRSCVDALRQRWPDRPGTWLVAARALMRVDPDEATRDAERLIAAGVHVDAARSVVGAVRLFRNDLDGAAQAYSEILASGDPDQRRLAAFNRGRIHQMRNELEPAEADFRLALSFTPNNATYLQGLAQVLDRRDEHAASIEVYERVLRLEPERATAWSDLGVALQRAGRVEEAVEKLSRATELDPRLIPPVEALVGLFLERRDTDAAETQARQLIGRRGDTPEAHWLLGRAQRVRGDLDAARESFERAAARLRPPLWQREPWCFKAATYANVGGELARLRAWEPAARAFARALDYGYTQPTRIHNALGDMWLQAGDAERALAAFDAATAGDDRAALGQLNRGRALAALGRSDAAIAATRAAIEFGEATGTAHANLGVLLLGRDDVDGAVEALRTALRCGRRTARTFCVLGHALTRSGRAREGVGFLRQGHAAGTRTPGWSLSSAQWLEAAEREAAREPRLVELLSGTGALRDDDERLELAVFAHRRGEHRRAVELFTDVLARLPAAEARHRETAIAAAARAGIVEAGEPDTATRASMRAAARRWLSADLARLRGAIEAGGAGRASARAALRRWQQSWPLRGLRDPAFLARLPAAEREGLGALWREVAALLAPE